jgi:hypothetical protein
MAFSHIVNNVLPPCWLLPAFRVALLSWRWRGCQNDLCVLGTGVPSASILHCALPMPQLLFCSHPQSGLGVPSGIPKYPEHVITLTTLHVSNLLNCLGCLCHHSQPLESGVIFELPVFHQGLAYRGLCKEVVSMCDSLTHCVLLRVWWKVGAGASPCLAVLWKDTQTGTWDLGEPWEDAGSVERRARWWWWWGWGCLH